MKGTNCTFDNFIAGEENRVTYLAAQRIARAEPGLLFNPFYIYGDVGTGKSHLLLAIAAEIEKSHPGFNIVNERAGNIVEEVKTTDLENIIQRMADANFLLMDDIHYLSQLNENVAKISNALINLLNQDVQLVLSANTPPKDLKLDNRLVSIIESGLVCSLIPPREMTRLEILKKMCENKGVILSDEIFGELARIPFKSVRELEGALNRVLAYSSIGEIAIDRNLLMMALKEYYQEKHTEPVVTSFLEEMSEEIDKAIAEVESEDLIRKQFEEKIYIWSMKGFKTDSIKDFLNQDIESLKTGYDNFVKKIEELVELQREYGLLDLSNYPELTIKIEELLFDPERIEELKGYIKEAKGIRPLVKFGVSFDELIIGECNRIPVELARKAIKDPGKELNPLTIIGESGTGKTSLLWAIGNDLTANNPDLKIVYLDFSHPTSEIPKADVLLLDNTELVPQEMRTELINAIKSSVEENKQVILSSTVPPLRFEWLGADRQIFEVGVETELKSPDENTAREYLVSKGSEPPASLPQFGSFYDLEKYYEFEEKPVSLGLPGEGEEEELAEVDEQKLIFPTEIDNYILDETATWQ
ncbi:MAG TPA: AAA family ATPase [bacterium (Candidatus Stahlbacteria)]|nr:AAA family ATPase [Candidatus Stahlbacteria bacterium]